jgi:hypothetical protein
MVVRRDRPGRWPLGALLQSPAPSDPALAAGVRATMIRVAGTELAQFQLALQSRPGNSFSLAEGPVHAEN